MVTVSMVQVIPVHHLHTPVTATMDCFNRVRAHECRNVTANRHFRDIEIAGQIVIGVVPSMAQHFQQFLASFSGTHMLTPPSIALWGR